MNFAVHKSDFIRKIPCAPSKSREHELLYEARVWCENAGLAERLEEANVKVTKYCDLCGGFIGVHAMPISRGKIASLAKLKSLRRTTLQGVLQATRVENMKLKRVLLKSHDC